MNYRIGFSIILFLFKQKTAYEMRISDCSSDVCSSDLAVPRDGISRREFGQPAAAHGAARGLARTAGGDARQGDHRGRLSADPRGVRRPGRRRADDVRRAQGGRAEIGRATSELQSLMSISYAVFCLKKKNTTTQDEM